MRFSLALSILPLAISVGALSVTEPKKGDVIAPGASVDVKWTSVNTDASSFDIYLVNNAVYPSVNKKLVANVETSKDSQNVNVGNIPAGPGYQINLVSDDPKNTGILAQTGQFNVTGSAESSTASTTSSVTSTSSASSTSTAPYTSTNSTSHSPSASATTLTSHTSSSSTNSTASVTTSQIVTTSTGVSTTAVITSEVTKTSGHSMTTSASASGTAATTSAPSTGAGAAVMAHPIAALGVVGGALAFVL